MMKASRPQPTQFADRRRRQRELGQGLVELCFLIPLLIILLVGIVDFGRVLMANNVVTSAARRGAWVASMSDTNQTTVLNTVKAYLQNAGLDPTKANINVSGTTAKAGELTVVLVKYPMTSMALKLVHTEYAFTLESSSSMPHE